MYDKIDKLIDVNLKLLNNSETDIHSDDFVNENGEKYFDLGELYNSLRLYIYLDKEELIITYKELCLLSKRGIEIVQNGGWIEYVEKQRAEIRKREKSEKIELRLSKSNIKANKLNEQNSKFNNSVNKINIIIGILNFVVAIIVGTIAYLSYKAGLLG